MKLSLVMESESTKQKKMVVIDSLARSGTTLLSAIFRTQRGCSCFTGMFPEGIVSKYAPWAHPMAQHPILPPSSEMLFEWQEMIEWVKAKIRTGKNCGISAADWNLLLEENCTNYEEVDQFYSKLADHMKSNLIAFRWNQCLSYFHNWTMRKNHSWVTIIRNPLSRSASHFESHNSGWEESLRSTIAYTQHLELLKDEKDMHIIFYEDLIENPKGVISRLFEQIDFPLDEVSLERLNGNDGGDYRSESVEAKRLYGSHKIGLHYQGIYKNATERFKDSMPIGIQNRYTAQLSEFEMLKRYF